MTGLADGAADGSHEAAPERRQTMNLLRTCIVALAVVGALAPAAGADPWFAERAPEASPPAVIAGDRPGEVARIQAVPPISGDRPADRARTSLVVPVAVASGASFDWVAAGVGAASAFALVGVVFGGLALAGRRRGLAWPT
jgi:hypothetical protein